MIGKDITQKFQTYSDDALLKEAHTLVEKERLATLELLECLEEVEVRMLFASLGYSSLWQFCTHHLGLSEGAAQRRISAMRLTRKVPEAKEAISKGKLSLSNASKLESFFNYEHKSGRVQTLEKKGETIREMAGLSQSECERKLFQISPEFEVSQKETLKPITQDQNLLKIVLDADAVENLNLLKDRLAHLLPNASYGELVQFLIQDKLKQIEAKMEPRKEKPSSPTAAAAVTPHRKAIPAETRRRIWKRAAGKCEFQTPEGNRCNSTHALEMDHIQLVAFGGTNETSNLRITCRTHNLYFAQKALGPKWMSQFVPRLRR